MPRIVAVEWLPAELLFALGITPIAVADIVSYRQWVQQPMLPPEVIDVGERVTPNLELMAALQPDMILYSAGYGPRAAQLKAVAPAMGIHLHRCRGKTAGYGARLHYGAGAKARSRGRRQGAFSLVRPATGAGGADVGILSAVAAMDLLGDG